MPLRLPNAEKIKKRARRAGFGALYGALIQKFKRDAPKQGTLQRFARDKVGRPQFAGHIVVVPLSLVGSLMLGEEYEDVAKDLAFVAGYEGADVVVREFIDKEPVIKLYTDKISLERFSANAEIRIFINGVEYDATKFQSPATYGTVDTTNNKLVTDGDGKFEASFVTPLASGTYTVAVVDNAGKAYVIEVEI